MTCWPSSRPFARGFRSSSTPAIVERHPFGGMRMSGVGSKAGGPDYLIRFMESRSVSENMMRHGFTPDVS